MRWRLVAVLALQVAVAHADTPQGTYRLDPGARTETYSARRVLPSCGTASEAFVTNTGPMNVEYRSAVKVNGRTWDRGESTRKHTVIVDGESMKPLVVHIAFQRNGKAKAIGVLAVLGLGDDGEFHCGDSIKLDGKFTP